MERPSVLPDRDDERLLLDGELQDKGTTENALNMDAHELKKREVYFIDVAKKGSSETLPADEVGVKSRD